MNLINGFSALSVVSMTLFSFTFGALSISAWAGKWIAGRRVKADDDDEVKIILGAALSLLGLLIGFTLSMAIGGYNNRQISENAEATAIRSAYMSADLISEPIRSEMKELLRRYLHYRIMMYTSEGQDAREESRSQSLKLQSELWTRAKDNALENPNPVGAIILSKISELMTTQQKTISEWRNQIPNPAWVLLILVGVFCNGLIGYSSPAVKKDKMIFILPFMTALSFMMITEIDVPGRGVIHVVPVNLNYLETIFTQSS